jgi:MoaA/NifB/PqqE/SkfB family radical SAM enzyme
LNGIDTKDGLLILDDHKLAYHYDRVQAWEAGERIAPVSIDMALTRACQAQCRGCYAMLQESDKRFNITVDHAYAFLEDCARMGVKAISLISDGESTLSKAYVPFILKAHEYGIDVGNATNGWALTPEILWQILPKLKWVRFTVLAGNATSYTRMMHDDPKDTHVFWHAMDIISTAVQIKRQKGLNVTLGIQTFVMPEDEAEILSFAQLGLDLGVDYAVIKHTSDDERGSLGVNYEHYERIHETLRAAEAMSTEDTIIIVKWQKIHDGNNMAYKQVYGPQFLLQISGSGLVAPSGMFFNARYAKYHIGNFTTERFYDLWQSDHYWRVMNYLASPEYDAQTMMGSLPIQHYANTALYNHIQGIERIEPVNDVEVLHKNFV